MKKATAALLGILLLAGCSDAVTQPAEDNANRKGAGMGKTTCKNLGKVGDLDDLLFQMPVGELERIWGIPVYDYTLPTDTASEEVNRRNSEEMDGYTLKRQADQDKYRNRLYWEVIKSNDYDPDNEGKIKNIVFQVLQVKNYGVFMQGRLPKLLPPPIILEKAYPTSVLNPPDVPPEIEGSDDYKEYQVNDFFPPENTAYKYDTEYFWPNPKQDARLPYLFIRTSDGTDQVLLSVISLHRNIDRPEILTLPKP